MHRGDAEAHERYQDSSVEVFGHLKRNTFYRRASTPLR